VRLFVRDHLDRVLDLAQEPVWPAERVPGFGGDPAAFGKFGQHPHCCLAPQFGKPAARYQLLGLHEELDLADTATAELDVVPLDRNFTMPLVGMDLALDRMDIRDRGVVEVLAPDVWLKLLQERVARLDVASDRPRLDHGGP